MTFRPAHPRRLGLVAASIVTAMASSAAVWGCAPAPSPPTSSPPAPSNPPPTPISCGTGAVLISVGDVAQQVVDAHPAGTTYVIAAGTHLGNFSVQPKSGDTFCGAPGAVLDGGRNLRSAFSGGATGVTLDSITVQDYASGRQGAAIQPDSHAGGWVVRNVSAVHNGWAGLLVADGMHILGGHYTDNDQIGIGGNSATDIVLDGLDGDPNTFDGPELARNHILHAPCDYEGGGMKWDLGRVTIRNAYVHDNDCKGLWADINAHDVLIEHNLVENNFAEGIVYEISQNAVIRSNEVHGNGRRGAGWYWGQRHHDRLELRCRGLRQPLVRQLQRDNGDAAGPFRLDTARPPARRLPCARQPHLRDGRGRTRDGGGGRQRCQPRRARHHLYREHDPIRSLPLRGPRAHGKPFDSFCAGHAQLVREMTEAHSVQIASSTAAAEASSMQRPSVT